MGRGPGHDCRVWSRLDPCAAVGDRTSTSRIINDGIAGFVGDRCLLDPHNHVVSTDSWVGVGVGVGELVSC